MFRIVKNRIKGLCAAHGCLTRVREKDLLCSKHVHRRRKIKDPCKYTYHVLKSNARRRGKEFKLTLREFRMFCQETKYLENKGRRPGDYTIDRIDASKGYEITNIQVITLYENSSKGYEEGMGCPF